MEFQIKPAMNKFPSELSNTVLTIRKVNKNTNK